MFCSLFRRQAAKKAFTKSVAKSVNTNTVPRSPLGASSRAMESPSSSTSEVDIKRASICAENFGKCSMKEMEKLKSGLHAERVKNFLDETAGVNIPEYEETEVDRRALEADLALQLSLLKNEMAPEPGNILGMPFPMDDPIPASVDLEKTSESVHEEVPSPLFESFVRMGEKNVLMREEVKEELIIIASILLIMLFVRV